MDFWRFVPLRYVRCHRHRPRVLPPPCSRRSSGSDDQGTQFRARKGRRDLLHRPIASRDWIRVAVIWIPMPTKQHIRDDEHASDIEYHMNASANMMTRMPTSPLKEYDSLHA